MVRGQTRSTERLRTKPRRLHDLCDEDSNALITDLTQTSTHVTQSFASVTYLRLASVRPSTSLVRCDKLKYAAPRQLIRPTAIPYICASSNLKAAMDRSGIDQERVRCETNLILLERFRISGTVRGTTSNVVPKGHVNASRNPPAVPNLFKNFHPN